MITWETRFNDLIECCRFDIFAVTSVLKEQNIAFKCKVNCILVQISTLSSMTQSGCWLRKALLNIRRIRLADEFNKESISRIKQLALVRARTVNHQRSPFASKMVPFRGEIVMLNGKTEKTKFAFWASHDLQEFAQVFRRRAKSYNQLAIFKMHARYRLE